MKGEGGFRGKGSDAWLYQRAIVVPVASLCSSLLHSLDIISITDACKCCSRALQTDAIFLQNGNGSRVHADSRVLERTALIMSFP